MLQSYVSVRRARWFALVLGFASFTATPARADLIDLDLSLLPVQYRAAFVEAERFWESRLIGFSGVIPRQILARLHNVEIAVTVDNIDGPGGVLAFAGPNDVFTYLTPYQNINVSQTASMTFDEDDIDGLLASGLLDEVVLHEMAHALGFGTLWDQNEFNAIDFFNYNATYGLRQYRHDSRQPLAQYVPVQQTPGSSGGHWFEGDTFFFDQNTFVGELMIPFLTEAPYVSEVTWAQFADLGYKVKGINDRINNNVQIPGSVKTVPNPEVGDDDDEEEDELGSPNGGGSTLGKKIGR